MNPGLYEQTQNPHYLGRGAVHFTAPLLPCGGVNMSAYGARWGTNWPESCVLPGELNLPPGRFVGNARTLGITPSVRRLVTSPWDTRSNLIVDGISASLVLHGHGAQSLADALHSVRSQPGSTQRAETIPTGRASIETGCMLFTRHLVDLQQPVQVKPSWTDWQEGAHWERSAHGIQIRVGFSGPVGSSIQIRYTPEGSVDNLDAMAAPGTEFGLSYAGINRIDGKPMRIDIWRCRPVLDGGLSPLTESFGSITLNLSILPVHATATAKTSWYRVQRGQHNTN